MGTKVIWRLLTHHEGRQLDAPLFLAQEIPWTHTSSSSRFRGLPCGSVVPVSFCSLLQPGAVHRHIATTQSAASAVFVHGLGDWHGIRSLTGTEEGRPP